MNNVRIRIAEPADADALGVVGPAAYAASYSYLWDRAEALARHLETFSSSAFRALLARPDARVWVAELETAIVGFLSMIVGSVDPIISRPNGAEIPRIYLLPGARRLGIGRMLLGAALDRALTEGLTHVWLDVMASADDTRATYAKWGFVEVGTRTFNKGVNHDLADMVVLVKELPPGAVTGKGAEWLG